MHSYRQRFFLFAATTTFVFALSAVGLGQGRIEAEAVHGEPFGVGRISINLPKQALPEPLGVEGLGIADSQGRVLYPALDKPADTTLVKDILSRSPLMRGGPVREQAGGLLMQLLNQPPKISLYFLFRGSEPLEMNLQTRQTVPLQIRPRHDPRAHARLLGRWWKVYTAEPKGLFQKKKADYPPLVQNYLRAMLSRRLGLPLPRDPKAEDWQTQLEHQVGLTLGTEALVIEIERDRMLGQEADPQKATLPLPAPPDPPEMATPEAEAEVKIEPIALRVPEQCLYVRFGSFANFLWYQDTTKKWGGDFGNLVALRGLDRNMTQRIEQQLILKQDAMARMFGGTLIADVAFVATDMFQREGAAFGLLFLARNGLLLKTDFDGKRSARVKQGGVTEQTLDIEGHKVSFIASPDGRVRSYFAADGNYLLVTTSRSMAREFLKTKDGQGALGASAEFRHARSLLPLDRDDTVFVYLSEAFFRNLTGPHYRIEMARRLQAVADIELAQLALLASAAEAQPGETLDELIAGGFLPPGFGPRADGSHAVLEEGDVVDSLRGHRGTFVPIPDVPVETIAPAEAREYQRFLDFYHEQWGGQMDPMMVGIRRKPLDEDTERVFVDIHASPFAQKHVEKLSQWIGAADDARLAPIPGDLIALEAQLTNQRLFGGIQDFGLPFEIVDGRLIPAGGLFNMIVGYVGTTGRLGFLSLLDRGIGAPTDAYGYAGREGGLWRHQDERFTVFSFQRHVLQTVIPQLRFEQASRPAQIRAHVGDVTQARLTPALNALGYLRTRETTLGNVRLMHTLEQQLLVPGPDCLDAAELLLDARLICPLGGEYEYRERPDGSGFWTSTALDDFGSTDFLQVQVPEGKQAPPLNWFRGLDLDATMEANRLSAHLVLDMKMPELPPAPKVEAIPAPSAEPAREAAEQDASKPANQEKTDPPKAKSGNWWDALLPSGKKE